MAAGVVSDEITTTFALRSRTTGETFTISNGVKGDGTSWAGPTITEVSTGTYQAVFTPDVIGVWGCSIVGDTTGEPFEAEWHIIAAPTRTFTRHANGRGNVLYAEALNELQAAIEDLSH